jgi:hypothetical protein
MPNVGVMAFLADVDAELRTQGEPVMRVAERQEATYEARSPARVDALDYAHSLLGRRRRSVATPNDSRTVLPVDVQRLFWAKSLLCAAHAEAEHDIVGFRQELLRGRLLRLDQVREWIEEAGAADGPPRFYVEAELPEGWKPGDPIGPLSPWISRWADQVQVLEDLRLDFAVPGSRFAHSITIARDGVLADLHAISLRLAREYPWQPAQATTFVLTGYTPFVAVIRSSTGSSRSTATLEFDPDAPSDLLVRVAARLRAAHVGGRARLVTPPRVNLVIYCAERADWTTRRLWLGWNDLNPDDAFATQRLFRQARRQAENRLLRIRRAR